GKDGTAEERAKLVVARFDHSTNRNQEPNLHTHCLVLNVGVTEGGSTRALDSTHIYQNKMLLGAIYRCQLSHELEKGLGLVERRVKGWFEVEGVPQRLCEQFSSRREEILEHLMARGLESASAASFAALATRQAKTHQPREEMFASWRAEGAAHAFGPAE